MNLNKLKEIFPKNKKTVAVIALVVLGIIFSVAFGGGNKKSEDPETLAEYKSRMEGELEKLCSSIDGVGKCTVKISFCGGIENIYKGGKLTETRPPEILGVVIACRGADSARVRQALCELFTSLYDIPSNRVAILKLN